MNTQLKRLLLIAAICLTSSKAEVGASLDGTVRDLQSRAVADANVTLFSRGGNASWSTRSGSSGDYRFTGLPEGDYILRVEAPGFATFVAANVHLGSGQPPPGQSMDVALQIAGVRDEVIVTASSTPQAPSEVSKATTVIDHGEADDRDSMALADALNLAPGLRVQQLGGPGAYTTFQIRGLRPEDTSVLVDGLRLRDASATQADASGLIEDLLFTDVDRVEVLRGAGSSLYGTNAIGGVVNVITDEGGGRTRGSLLLEGGSLGSFRGRAQVAGGWRHGQIDYSLGVTQLYVADGIDGDDPFRDTSLQGSVTFHVSPSIRLAARLYAGNSFGKVNSEPDLIGNPPGTGIINAVPLAPGELRLYEQGVPLSQLNTGAATFIPAPDDPDYTRAARYITGALILTGQPSAAVNYAVSYQVVANSRRFDDGPAGVGFQPVGTTRSLYDGRIQTVNAHIDYRPGSHNLLSAGYEFENENYAGDYADFTNAAAASATNVTQLSHTAFIQDQVRLFGDRLQISGAFRSQFFSLDAPEFTPEASAPYQGISFPAPPAAYTGDGSIAYFFRKSGTKLRAHAGRGYRSPSLYERFGTGFDPTFGYSVYGDPRLKPEHSLGGDAGVDQTLWHDRVKTSATYFYTALQNVITFDTSGLINPLTDPFGRSIGYINTQGGISRGVELSATLSPSRSLSISTAYTFVNAIERIPIVGDTLQTFVVPRNQFSILATDRVTSRLLLTFDTLATSDYLGPVYGEVTTQVFRFNGIHKLSLGASYRIPLAESRAVRFFVRVENLLDQTYFESGFPTPGRTGRGGMQFEF
jgi:vitamin B12 transporter